jgi:molecular chaperone IbpA
MKYTTTWANDPYMIGWESFFPRLETLAKTNSTAFPPYNVRKVDDDNFVIELAVAGYNKSNLTITEESNNLTVVGELPDTGDEYIHKGIAGRKFTRTFALAEHMVTRESHLVDGMLLISVERVIPEEKKPKAITINDFKNPKNG